jgi:hypothetical protein
MTGTVRVSRAARRCRHARSAGFTTLELLIATTLLMVITAGVAAMAGPMRDLAERSMGRADGTGGARFALDRIVSDLREAGSPPSLLPAGARFDALLTTILTLEGLGSAVPRSPGAAVRTLSVPHLAPQGVLAAPAVAGSVLLQLDPASPCTAVSPVCGFVAGTNAVLLDSAHAAIVAIQAVGPASEVRLQSPLATAFDAGTTLASIVSTTYGLRSEADGSWRLVRVRDGTEQPLLDHVVSFSVAASGADPSRITRVDVQLRLEAASAAMRGPAGYLFRRAGSATRARDWVPDIELRTSIARREVQP